MNDVEKLIFDLFKDKEIYLVGGYIRDKLLGMQSHDMDFATNCLPEETFVILEKANLHPHKIGWAFGTVGCVHNGYEYHITTYRKNESYTRNSRRPVVKWGETIMDDLKRRDFTINAIAMDCNGDFIDPFNGQEHIKQKLLQTPIEPDRAFSDDPLRMLRAIRFRCKLGFQYSAEIQEALYDNMHKVLTLSNERIVDELNKILISNDVDIGLEDLRRYKLLNFIIPELTVLNIVEQGNQYHHKDVWLHTVDVVKNIKNSIILRWASLLHDVGKPYTKTVDENNIHFYHHDDLSTFLAKSILMRLGLPKQWIKDIVFLVESHMRPNLYDNNWGDSAIRRFINDMGAYVWDVLELSRADITSHNPIIINRHLDLLNNLISRVRQMQEYKEVKSPLNGYEIMEYFKIEPGPLIGKIQKFLVEEILNGNLLLEMQKNVYFDYVKNNFKEEICQKK